MDKYTGVGKGVDGWDGMVGWKEASKVNDTHTQGDGSHLHKVLSPVSSPTNLWGWVPFNPHPPANMLADVAANQWHPH